MTDSGGSVDKRDGGDPGFRRHIRREDTQPIGGEGGRQTVADQRTERVRGESPVADPADQSAAIPLRCDTAEHCRDPRGDGMSNRSGPCGAVAGTDGRIGAERGVLTAAGKTVKVRFRGGIGVDGSGKTEMLHGERAWGRVALQHGGYLRNDAKCTCRMPEKTYVHAPGSEKIGFAGQKSKFWGGSDLFRARVDVKVAQKIRLELCK